MTTRAGQNDDAPLPRLPARPRDGHKGTFGTVVIIGGSETGIGASGTVMLGAPALSATAALRAGAGLAKIAAPAGLLPHCLALCPSATGIALPTDANGLIPHETAAAIDDLIARATCIAVGPGLGVSPGAEAAVLRCIQQEEASVVVDADGLNCLAALPELFRDFHAAAVLTPHPGEFKRLCAALGLTNALGLETSRENACTQLAQRLGRIVVLKGQATVVSDGLRTWTCPAGHPCLATAGTGDILTGLIAGLIAQYCATPSEAIMRAKVPQMPINPLRPLSLYDAARLGVLIHAQCGERWAQDHGASAGLLALELTELIPTVLESHRSA